MRILKAAAGYFAIVFGAGFALGPIRVLLLEPRVGPAVAALCEAPFLLIAMFAAGRWLPCKLGLARDIKPLAAMGVIALIFQQAADFAVGVFIRGIGAAEQIAHFATKAGMIYAVLLLAFAAMPALANVSRRGRRE